MADSSTPLVAGAAVITAPPAPAPKRMATVPSSWINLSNTILGAGMLGVPFGIAKAGLGFGFGMLVLCGFLAGLGLHLLSLACAEAELTSGDNAPNATSRMDEESDALLRSSTGGGAAAAAAAPPGAAGSDRGGAYAGTHFSDYGGKGQPAFPHSETIPVASFFTFAKMTYPALRYVIDGAIAVKCFGVSISYLIVCGDLMPQVMKHFLGKDNHSIFVDRHFWILCSIAVTWPLAFLPRLDSLKYASVVALGSMAYLVFIIVYYFIKTDGWDNLAEVRYFPSSGLDMVATLPIFVFAFTCSQNLPTIAAELPRAYGARINAVVVMAMSTCVVAYAIIGGFGYLSFLDNVESDIVKNYPDSLLVSIGRIALVANVLLSFPLQVHPARNSLNSLIFPNLAPHEKSRLRVRLEHYVFRMRAAVGNDPNSDSTRARHIFLTLCLAIGAYLVAWVVKSLGLVFAIVGATGSTTIAYILPGLFAFKLLEPTGWTPRRFGALGLIILGFSVMGSALTIIVLSASGIIDVEVGG